MKAWLGMTAVATLMLAGQALAADKMDMAAGQALAQSSACLSCHGVDKKIVGPAFKDVAAKYKGNKAAEAMLIEKITKGGSGTWGPVPMPPNAQVKPADIKILAKWVLAQ